MEFCHGGDDRGSPSYYGVLGVGSDSSAEEIRRAYLKLAMQWHPDKWTRCPSLLGEAKRKFQQIQEAYSVLSDERKRTMYDVGLYDPHGEDEDDEGLSDFMQEMVSLMAQTSREEKSYSIEELQAMLVEMAQGFESPRVFYGPPSVFEDSGCSKRTRLETNPTAASGLGATHVKLGLLQFKWLLQLIRSNFSATILIEKALESAQSPCHFGCSNSAQVPRHTEKI